MSRGVLALGVVASLAGCSPRWIMKDRGQKVLLATSTALVACDWGMTRWMPKTGAYERGYSELNLLMGSNPSLEQVDAVFALSLAGLVAAYPILPRWARAWLYTSVTVLEAANVAYFNPSGICGDFGAVGHER